MTLKEKFKSNPQLYYALSMTEKEKLKRMITALLLLRRL